MDRFSLIVVASILVAGSAHAGYALPAPPAGFGGSPGSWTFSPPANAPTIGGGAPASNLPTFRGPGPTLPSAGGGVPTSAAFRVGSSGARVLAGRAVAGLIPGVGVALAAAWLFQHCYEKQGGAWVRTCFPSGEQPPVSDGFEYRADNWVYDAQQWFPTKEAACEMAVSWLNANAGPHTYTLYSCTTAGGVRVNRTLNTGEFQQNYTGTSLMSRSGACPAGWYVTPAGCVQTPPPQTVTEQEVIDDMSTKPLPNPLPLGVPYPLDPQSPFIFNPTPGDNPQGQPLRVPQGNPVPIPNTNPQQYRQPVTRWAHSPSPTEPWRMSADPQDAIGDNPQGMTEPQSETSGTPAGEKPEQFDLCKEHPDIIACQVFKPDELEAKPVPNENKTLAITPDGGWGASSASCPADKSASLSFGPIAFSYEPLCLFASGIRPMVIALAWFSAALTFFGFARKDT